MRTPELRRKRGSDRVKIKMINATREEVLSSWSVTDVCKWVDEIGLSQYKSSFIEHQIDGLALLMLSPEDLRRDLKIWILGDAKRLSYSIATLRGDSQRSHESLCSGYCNVEPTKPQSSISPCRRHYQKAVNQSRSRTYSSDSQTESVDGNRQNESGRQPFTNACSGVSGTASNLTAEYFKTLVSCFYMFLVTWVTAIVMVFVHDRVPDKARHPPLPDIFLDNVPHISWAFQLCEITILILTCTWLVILFFHRHRSILLRRFCALSGSVFLLRCATMFITSLSVPGHHLECSPREETEFWTKLDQAWIIWRGGGLSIKGVRTCGDYMFSGHTTALTVLNFFITEYTPRRMYFLHILSWVLNTFGIFFILAAHEHYSIDVFIAFYITSRMFMYYHSLANNRALHQRDAFRTKIWFPMFSYFELEIDGIVPNEYANPLSAENFVAFGERLFGIAVKVKMFVDGYGQKLNDIPAKDKNS